MTGKKKVTIIVFMSVILFFGIYILIQCTHDRLFTFSKKEVTSAFIRSGPDGSETNMQEKDISYLYDAFSNISLERVKNIDTSGWTYYVGFTTGDKSAGIEIISSTVWIIDGKRYHVSEKEGKKILEYIENTV